MNYVYIMRGISGAGKSTLSASRFPTACVCSADHYFGHGSEYKFDARLLGQAHSSSFAKFTAALGVEPVIVVDNTNTKIKEFRRYIEAVQHFNSRNGAYQAYEIVVIRIKIESTVAAARNLHGVPADKVQAMQDRFQDYPGEMIVQH